MIQKIASSLTEYSVSRNWISSSKTQWCQYALEKRLGMLVFISICCIFAAITSTWIEVLIFTLVLYLFRRRLGGWHARTFCSCQLISIGTVIATILSIGPLLELVATTTLIILDISVIICTYALRPIYPSSAHFTQDITLANTKKKNHLLLILVVFQCICLKLKYSLFLTYSLLGLAIADISVLLQYYNTRREE